MCHPAIIAAVAVGAAGGAQAYSQYKEGAATEKYYKTVADIQEQQGRIELARGEKQAELVQDSAKYQGKQQKDQAAQVASSQRAALVANGIDLSSVTASDLSSDVISKSKADELAIRYNADIQSWNIGEDAKFKKWSLDTEASNSRTIGKNAKASGKRQAFTTLLATAASVATIGAGGFGGGAKAPMPKPEGLLG